MRTTPESRPSPVKAWTWPEDAEAVADQFPDLVEDLREVAARLPLQDHRRDEEPQVEVGHAIAHRPQAVVHGHAQVLLFEHAAELLSDRLAHLGGHGVEAEGQALPGPQDAGHHFQGVGKLRAEGLQPLLPPPEEPEHGQRTGGDRRQRDAWPRGSSWPSPRRTRPAPGPPRTRPACPR